MLLPHHLLGGAAGEVQIHPALIAEMQPSLPLYIHSCQHSGAARSIVGPTPANRNTKMGLTHPEKKHWAEKAET